jgi:hypothetical protein
MAPTISFAETGAIRQDVFNYDVRHPTFPFWYRYGEWPGFHAGPFRSSTESHAPDLRYDLLLLAITQSHNTSAKENLGYPFWLSL